MPKISVIVPVYNVEPYLAECLDSALGQTLEDIEVICVNDGSTDGSGEILREYASRDARMTVVEQENRGLSEARNAGVARATGEYLYFLDSDDYIDTNAFEVLYRRSVSDDLDVLNFDAVPFFEGEGLEVEHAEYADYYRRTGSYEGVTTGPELLTSLLANWDYKPPVWLLFIKAEFYRSAGLSFYPGIVHEDNLFSFLCSMHARRTAYLPEPFFHRRVRANSIMTAEKSLKNFEGYFITYLEMLRFVNGKEYDAGTSAAVGELMASMYRQAYKVLRRLPWAEVLTIDSIDTHPDALAACVALQREVGSFRKARKVKRKLGKKSDELERIQRSFAYRLYRRVKHPFKASEPHASS